MNAHFGMMAKYNEWANSRLYRMAATLHETLHQKDVGAYFRSLHGTLNHLLVADRIWMRRLTGSGQHPDNLSTLLFEDLASLRAARVEEDRRIIAFVDSLNAREYDESLDYQTMDGTPQRQRRREVLAHLFNHQTHHRGQSHTILTLLGVAEPETLDLLIMQQERN